MMGSGSGSMMGSGSGTPVGSDDESAYVSSYNSGMGGSHDVNHGFSSMGGGSMGGHGSQHGSHHGSHHGSQHGSEDEGPPSCLSEDKHDAVHYVFCGDGESEFAPDSEDPDMVFRCSVALDIPVCEGSGSGDSMCEDSYGELCDEDCWVERYDGCWNSEVSDFETECFDMVLSADLHCMEGHMPMSDVMGSDSEGSEFWPENDEELQGFIMFAGCFQVAGVAVEFGIDNGDHEAAMDVGEDMFGFRPNTESAEVWYNKVNDCRDDVAAEAPTPDEIETKSCEDIFMFIMSEGLMDVENEEEIAPVFEWFGLEDQFQVLAGRIEGDCKDWEPSSDMGCSDCGSTVDDGEVSGGYVSE